MIRIGISVVTCGILSSITFYMSRDFFACIRKQIADLKRKNGSQRKRFKQVCKTNCSEII